MRIKRISQSVFTLALLATLSACSSNDTEQTKNPESKTIATSNDMKKGGPGRGKPPRRGKQRTVCEALKEGPNRSSEHGPMDNADLNRDGTVLREELESFMDRGRYRRITILTFFEQFDIDKDGKLSTQEFSKVDPPHGFDGTDADGDCVVTQQEVFAYANQAGRSYRKIGLGEFFNQIDSNGDNKATPIEIEAAHTSGLLARF